MGRRAADLTTSVPVLGVPALVGARCWRTTAGERSGGALLPTCGPQSSVGVQTSPGISGLPIQHGAELTGVLSRPSGYVTPDGYIAKETEYKEVSLLTKCDKEKRAILKLKSGESKTKKEVTFKALCREASKDATCGRKSVNGKYCYAKAVKSNPIFTGNVNGVKPKPRAARYTNGSVVDSEAIGGISVESTEVDVVKNSTSHDKNQTRLQGFYAEKTEKTLLVSAGRTLQMPQKICSHCGGRQSVIAVGEKSYSVDPCLGKKPQIERNLQSSRHEISESGACGDKRSAAGDNPKLLYQGGDPKRRETPHPACPVHSRTHLVPLLLKHGVSDATSAQLYARAVTITQATIEARLDDPGAKKPAPQPSPGGRIPRPTSLPLTPYMAMATEPSEPGSHIQPRLPRQHNVPQSVCVSVHAVPENTLPPPPPPSVYTSAVGHRNTSVTEMHQKRAALPANAGGARREIQSLNRTARLNAAAHLHCTPRKTVTCSSVSLADNPSHPSHPLETATQAVPASHPSTPSNQGQKPSLHTDGGPTAAFAHAGFFTPGHVACAPRPPASTTVPRRPLQHSSIKMVLTPTRHSCAIAPNLSFRPKYSSSEPVLHVSPAPQRQIPDATSLRDLKVGLFSAVAPISASMYKSIMCKNTALRNSSVNVKNSSPTASPSSLALTESPRSITISGTILFRPADEAQHPPRLIGGDTNQLGPTRSPGSGEQTSDKSALYGVVSSAQSNSAGNRAVVSEAMGLSRQRSVGVPDSDKFIANLIHKLEACESKSHEDFHPSQVDGHHGGIPLIKSSGSCLQGRTDTQQQQQKPVLSQGFREKECEGRRTACPPVQTFQGQDLTYKRFAGVPLMRHADVGDEQKHGNNPATLEGVAPGAVGLSPQNTRPQDADATSGTVACKMSNSDPSLLPRPHTGLPQVPPSDSKADLCVHPGPECNLARPSSAIRPVSPPRPRPCQEESVVGPQLRPRPRPCPEDSGAAHSHPANAALLLPPSPQCCESASLQQRLESVEASLAANKDRITTLLNIIHDLETCHSPSSG